MVPWTPVTGVPTVVGLLRVSGGDEVGFGGAVGGGEGGASEVLVYGVDELWG